MSSLKGAGERGGAALRILVLDDVAEDAELALRELRSSGLVFEAQVVSSPRTFSEALRSFAPDLVLSDYSLPQMDGLAALAMVRELDPGLPVIVLSGAIGEEQAIETLKAGATDYVLKNRMSRLPLAVRRALREAEERDERQRAEAELRQSERLYRTMVGALGEGLILAYGDERIGTCNARGALILGIPAEEVVSRTISDPAWSFVRDDETPLPVDEFPVRLTLRTGRPREGVSLGFKRPDGSIAWLSVNCEPVFGADPATPEAVVCSFADVTERRTLEEQLRQSQKLESIGQLAGGIAHDFNNLMTVVTGYSDILLSQIDPSDPLHKEVEEIHKAGERATALTRQLLAFSRKQLLVPKRLDLNEVIASALPMLRRLVREDVRIAFHPGNGLHAVRADPSQIDQVVLNLASNAGDAMPHGGVLTFETDDVELDADYARGRVGVAPGPHVMLSVSDTGSGMDARTQARVFEPFYTTKPKGKGTGLGLATVYGIIKQSGGHIWLYSELGRGTTFKIYLPRAEGEAVAEIDRSEPVAASLRGDETVLLVEDETLLRPLIRAVLERQGYRVLEAESGAAALGLCSAHPGTIALMVTDVVMPGMGGEELAQRVAGVRPEMRVLFLSGYSDQAILEQGLLRSHHAFLQKPFSTDALARKVRLVLGTPATS